MDEETRQRFWDLVCAFQRPLLAGMAILGALLALSLFSLFFVDRGSAAYVVLQVDLLLLIGALSSMLYAIYRCLNRHG